MPILLHKQATTPKIRTPIKADAFCVEGTSSAFDQRQLSNVLRRILGASPGKREVGNKRIYDRIFWPAREPEDGGSCRLACAPQDAGLWPSLCLISSSRLILANRLEWHVDPAAVRRQGR